MNRKYEPVYQGCTVDNLTVMYTFRDTKNNRQMVHCICNICSREKEISENQFRKGIGTSHAYCNYRLKNKDENEAKFKDVWAHMKDRIYNPNNTSYKNYGGRGLTTDYDNYVDFKDDLYLKYLEFKQNHPGERVSIDRINNNIGYIRGNCRWTTPIHQTRNSRTVREFIAISPDGQIYITNNQLAFGNNHGLESKHISDCLKGKQKTTGGWRFQEIPIGLFVYQYRNDPRIIKELYY